MDSDVNTATSNKSKKPPVIAIVAVGCLGLLVLLGVGFTIAGKVLFSKIGANLVKQGIESKTGLKVNTDSKSGSFSVTDSKTGQTVNVGEQKIPDNFPKDFPIYPGAKPTGSLSGSNSQDQSQGYWIVLSSTDNLDKIKTYYDTNLTKNGWIVDNTMKNADMNLYSVKKGNIAGALTITRANTDKETTITVSLGNLKETPVAEPTENPTDTSTTEPSM
jgi:hypothetical protein